MKGLLTASLAALFAQTLLAQTPAALTASQRQEVADLKAKAALLTKEVGRIASNSNLQDDDNAVKLLQKIADELGAIRDRLKALEDGRKEDQKRTDKVSADVDALKNTKFNGYIQFQYFNSNQHGGSQPNAFLVRRARLGLVQTIDPRATLRLSAEFAEDTNRMDTRLKDAILDYDMKPTFGFASKASFGQMPIPIGYDIERSDADRELPERAVYNRTEFNNERSRGVILRGNPGKHIEVGVGAMDALTVDDAEQSGLAPGQGSQIAAIGYIRALGPGYRLGISGFTGQRPAFTASSITSPEVKRSFLYFDAEYHPTFLPNLTIRAEAMTGHDRVPSSTATATKTGKPMSGFQATATYDLSTKNQLNFRIQQFDPDLSTGGNAINGYGVSYQYFLSPVAKFQLSHELFTDESRASINQRRYYQTTLRLQFKF
ncbi:MAG TPA: porin [Fimbriimonadaceae bacterium]|nr:porin [Fimbriimonadaceae bacterium]